MDAILQEILYEEAMITTEQVLFNPLSSNIAMEADDGQKKEGIIQRLKNNVVRMIRWLMDKWSRFIGFIRKKILSWKEKHPSKSKLKEDLKSLREEYEKAVRDNEKNEKSILDKMAAAEEISKADKELFIRRIFDLEGTKAELQAKVGKLKLDLKHLGVTNEINEQKLREFSKRCAEYEKLNQELESELSILKKEISDKDAKIASKEAEIRDHVKRYQERTVGDPKLARRIQDLKYKYDSTTKAVKAIFDALENADKELKEESVDAAARQLKLQIGSLQKECSIFQKNSEQIFSILKNSTNKQILQTAMGKINGKYMDSSDYTALNVQQYSPGARGDDEDGRAEVLRAARERIDLSGVKTIISTMEQIQKRAKAVLKDLDAELDNAKQSDDDSDNVEMLQYKCKIAFDMVAKLGKFLNNAAFLITGTSDYNEYRSLVKKESASSKIS